MITIESLILAIPVMAVLGRLMWVLRWEHRRGQVFKAERRALKAARLEEVRNPLALYP